MSLNLRIDERLFEEGEQMRGANVELELLERLRESCLVEEGVGSVSESGLEEVFIKDCVELVCTQHDRHYK